MVITYKVGDPTESECIIPDQSAKEPLKCDAESDTTAQMWDTCLLVERGIAREKSGSY